MRLIVHQPILTNHFRPSFGKGGDNGNPLKHIWQLADIHITFLPFYFFTFRCRPLFLAISIGVCNRLAVSALQNAPFWPAKRPVSACETARFRTRNGAFRKAIRQTVFFDTPPETERGDARLASGHPLL